MRFKQIFCSLLLNTIFGCYNMIQLDQEINYKYNGKSKIPINPKLKWVEKTRDPIQNLIPVNDSLALLWSHRGTVMIMNLNNGKKKGHSWSPSKGHISNIELNHNADWFVFSSIKNRQAGIYNLRSGKQVWKTRIKDIIKDGILIVADTSIIIATRKELHLYNAENGILKKSNYNRLGITKLLFSDSNYIFLLTDSGELQCYNQDLYLLWNQNININTESKIIVYKDEIFVGPGKGSLWILDKKFGYVKKKLPFENGLDFQIFNNNELILVDRHGQISKLKTDNNYFWTTNFQLGLPSKNFIINDQYIFIPYSRGIVLNIDSSTGKEIWRSLPMKRLTGFWPTEKGFLVQDTKYSMMFYQ